MKNKFLFIQLFMIGLLLTLTNSCKKDDSLPTGDGGLTSVVFNPNKTYGTMTDQDGNTYKTITIGTQTWMAENLRVTKYRNGDPIPNITDNTAWIALTTGAYCTHSNTTDKNQIATYGRLYNWYAINDSRNIAPKGWHVPSDAEWTTLITFLGGESVAGSKMKETGTTHWSGSNTGSTNESGFSATPVGSRNYIDGTFDIFLGGNGDWWSSTASDASLAWNRHLYNGIAYCSRNDYLKLFGLAVRLVKD